MTASLSFDNGVPPFYMQSCPLLPICETHTYAYAQLIHHRCLHVHCRQLFVVSFKDNMISKYTCTMYQTRPPKPATIQHMYMKMMLHYKPFVSVSFTSWHDCRKVELRYHERLAPDPPIEQRRGCDTKIIYIYMLSICQRQLHSQIILMIIHAQCIVHPTGSIVLCTCIYSHQLHHYHNSLQLMSINSVLLLYLMKTLYDLLGINCK